MHDVRLLALLREDLMPSFTFDTDKGERTVRTPDEATARTYLESQLYHPDPTKTDDQPYTRERLAEITQERRARAAALTLLPEKR
ncbi:hypothetical protein ACLQ2R_17060 [Streptosporangium sp. DT93]|uniref:hypothetical protein n=1 Tax=Streptosporangium sp. DT93 TaxID=3393428 RepID=UPI003CEDBD7A